MSVRVGYVVLASLAFGPALALGYGIVREWGSLDLLPCSGGIACDGAPPILSWPFVLLLLLGAGLLWKGHVPSHPTGGPDGPAR